MGLFAIFFSPGRAKMLHLIEHNVLDEPHQNHNRTLGFRIDRSATFCIRENHEIAARPSIIHCDLT